MKKLVIAGRFDESVRHSGLWLRLGVEVWYELGWWFVAMCVENRLVQWK